MVLIQHSAQKQQLMKVLLESQLFSFQNGEDEWKWIMKSVQHLLSNQNRQDEDQLRKQLIEILNLDQKVFDFEIFNEVLTLKNQGS